MHVVIGGSDGLGKKIIESLNELGLETVNIARRKNSDAGINILGDITKGADLQTVIRELKNVEAPIEAMYISAGVFSFQELNNVLAEEFDRVFTINTQAPFLLISALLSRIKVDNTDIIFINSVAGLRPYKNQSLYNASKAALHSLTKDLRAELSNTPSRVIGVYPGMIDTDLAQKLPHSPLPKSKHTMIDPKVLADYIVYTQQLPRSIEVTDIIMERKKLI
ncbi:MAG TPA: SDR family oxidoreductase [Candidatus Saccharibacteria bacterium]|nr:SDR family oxidoreductase [Candidatus Saccharibacteria bacterium]